VCVMTSDLLNYLIFISKCRFQDNFFPQISQRLESWK
jgi:hypothetical protein